ncbi:MAG: YjeF-like protein carbohydrate kinase [Candidatus Roizmanbacteria bacterium GW2011_GWA2_35_19]|uniref:ADP-dependent (S)-NAD(P)H-hydrate dehydratase n=1 Tax=Candidatus Roizmanbacteria bacterium GW2011_GWA2_35_19 TaxID=1618478 RepID=A0A0G0BYZ4_9BACT|nr:MAG: YjeF-like protein carbohydrate kinase [Candidatus Roizmanbacteria bacterium GW2011_GWA2_35_19]
MLIQTSDLNSIKTLFKKFVLPKSNSHKGQNGKVLIIGGSSLFHAASLWSAEVASHFVDMVHYSSTIENEKIFHELKKVFRNGMIVPQSQLEHYAAEDDVILLGPGMMRDGNEGKYTFEITKKLIEKFSEKKFVFDAGALQMMSPDLLLRLKNKAIITPHQKEFERLFGIPVLDKPQNEKEIIVKETAKKYGVVILLKAIIDIVSDGVTTYIIEGGNAGMTKGGTGDVMSSLCTSFYIQNNPLEAALFSSLLLKITAEELFKDSGYWYNVSDIIDGLPKTLNNLILK